MNKAEEKVLHLLEEYPKFAEDNKITDPQKQYEDVFKIRRQGIFIDPDANYWRNRSLQADRFMLEGEIDYDKYCDKLRKKFGDTAIDQIKESYTDDMLKFSNEMLEEQTRLREVYTELNKKQDDIENEYYSQPGVEPSWKKSEVYRKYYRN